MKKIAMLISGLLLAGCSTVQSEYVKTHEDVFGCPPAGMEGSVRTLDAEGPKVERDFLGNECGKPVYTAPKCLDCGVPGK